MATFLSLLFAFSLAGYYLYNRMKINKFFNILNTTSEILNQDRITEEEVKGIVGKITNLFEEEGLEEVDEDSFFKNLEEFKEYGEKIESEKIF